MPPARRTAAPPVTLLSAAVLSLASTGAAAQTGPLGIAYVQAPEQGGGVAMGATPEEALAGARQGCIETGADARDCLPIAWCMPAGWSVDVFVQHVEGIHWHEFYCGLPERAIAEQVANAVCNLDARPWLVVCQAAQVYDPDGVPQFDP